MMRRAEGTFSLDRLGGVAPYDDRDRVRSARAHISTAHADTLDYEF